jgi:hypothetical protein
MHLSNPSVKTPPSLLSDAFGEVLPSDGCGWVLVMVVVVVVSVVVAVVNVEFRGVRQRFFNYKPSGNPLIKEGRFDPSNSIPSKNGGCCHHRNNRRFRGDSRSL